MHLTAPIGGKQNDCSPGSSALTCNGICAMHPLQASALQLVKHVTSCSLRPNVDVYQHTGMDVAVELVCASFFEGDSVDVPHCLADPVRVGAQ